MQASGRSVNSGRKFLGEFKVFWRTVWGLLSQFGGIAVTDCIGGPQRAAEYIKRYRRSCALRNPTRCDRHLVRCSAWMVAPHCGVL